MDEFDARISRFGGFYDYRDKSKGAKESIIDNHHCMHGHVVIRASPQRHGKRCTKLGFPTQLGYACTVISLYDLKVVSMTRIPRSIE